MQLDQLQAVLRPRTAWEAVDLGFAMVRRWRRPIYAAWLVLVVPAQLLVLIVLHRAPLAALLVTWWLIPLWERVALQVLSRALFGDTPRVAGVARAMPGIWWRTAARDLLWSRTSPVRALLMPVRQLEGLTGAAARRRRAVLGRGQETVGAWVGAVSLGFELVVASGLVALVVWSLPDVPRYSIEALAGAVIEGEAGVLGGLVPALLLVLASGFVAPFHAGAGFGLYLSRRTALEGWDIELVFRRLAQRLGRAAVVVLGAICLAGPVRAQELPPTPEQVIVEVLEDPAFGGTESRQQWRLRWREPTPEQLPEQLSGVPGLAIVAEALLWALAGAALVLLVLATLRVSLPTRSRREGGPELSGPVRTVGSPRPQPVAPVETARRLWSEGRRAEALGVLYEAAVAVLVNRDGLEIELGATEAECLRVVRDRAPESLVAPFQELTGAWQAAAYAHRAPDGEAFEALCGRWSERFGGAA